MLYETTVVDYYVGNPAGELFVYDQIKGHPVVVCNGRRKASRGDLSG